MFFLVSKIFILCTAGTYRFRALQFLLSPFPLIPLSLSLKIPHERPAARAATGRAMPWPAGHAGEPCCRQAREGRRVVAPGIHAATGRVDGREPGDK
jgi:hypothetical protein